MSVYVLLYEFNDSIILIISLFSLNKTKTSIDFTMANLFILSSSSNKTLPFDFDNISLTKSKSYINENNLNQNANDNDKYSSYNCKSLLRFIQSSTDISMNEIHSSRNQLNLSKTNRATRIESALLTSDYSNFINHSLNCSSKHVIDMNTNQTIDQFKRHDAGDEICNEKSSQYSILTDQNHYLTVEQIPVYNRSKLHFTSVQLILMSIIVFIFVILLSLITIFFLI